MASSPATVNQLHAAPPLTCAMAHLQSAVLDAAGEIDRAGAAVDCKTVMLRSAAIGVAADQCCTAENGISVSGFTNRKSSNMVARPVARRRKSALTKSQSANISRNSKRRRGGGTFSRKMVISSSIAAAVPQTRKLIEFSPDSPERNQLNLSICLNGGKDIGANEATTIRTPLPHSDSFKIGLKATVEATPSVPPAYAPDSLFDISNQAEEWYADCAEALSPDSEHSAVTIGKSAENEEDHLAESEPHVEFFTHLRRKLQQLVAKRLNLREAEAGHTNLPGTQTVGEIMKRLDLGLSNTSCIRCFPNDKVKGTLTGSARGSCTVSNPQSRINQIEEFRGRDCGTSHRIPDHELDVPRQYTIDTSTNDDPLNTAYWSQMLNVDLLGPAHHSQSRICEQAGRGNFSRELLPFAHLAGHQSCYDTQISDRLYIKPSYFPTASTCTRLHRQLKDPSASPGPAAPDHDNALNSLLMWEQKSIGGPSWPTSESDTEMTTRINESFSPSHYTVNLHARSSDRLLTICSVAYDDDEYDAATIRQQTKASIANGHEVLQDWENIQEDRSPPNPLPISLKNYTSPESPDNQLALMIPAPVNETMLSSLERPPSHRLQPEPEIYWDTAPASSEIQCQLAGFITSTGSAYNLEILEPANLECSRFRALREFDLLEFEVEEESESFDRQHESREPTAFRRDSLDEPDTGISSQDWSGCYWVSSMVIEHDKDLNVSPAQSKLMDTLLDDCSGRVARNRKKPFEFVPECYNPAPADSFDQSQDSLTHPYSGFDLQ